MELRTHDDVNAFLGAAAPLLAADEARHNLGFGICSTLIESPETYEVFHLWTVEENGAVLAAAVMTPPFNIWVARPRDPAGLDYLARELDDAGVDPPGVTAALPEADQFAAAWEGLRPVRRRLVHGQGIYKIESVRTPDGVDGEMRDATEKDRRIAIDWFEAFGREALGDDSPMHDLEANVDRRIDRRGGGLVFWEDAGEVVSLAGFGGETPNGMRIGPVYTPPELRRRGYASALTPS
jgi:hypothetical protein